MNLFICQIAVHLKWRTRSWKVELEWPKKKLEIHISKIKNEYEIWKSQIALEKFSQKISNLDQMFPTWAGAFQFWIRKFSPQWSLSNFDISNKKLFQVFDFLWTRYNYM